MQCQQNCQATIFRQIPKSHWQRFVASILNTKAPFGQFEVYAWGVSIAPSSEISLYTVQKVKFDEMIEPWWSSYMFVGCVICKRLPTHIGQEQACSRITWLFVRSFVNMPKMAQYKGKWLLTAP